MQTNSNLPMDRGNRSNVLLFPARSSDAAPVPPARPARERLKAAHRRTACRLGVIFGDSPAVSRLTSAAMHRAATMYKASVRRHVTRLAKLVGVVSTLDPCGTYTLAMFEVYARAARGEDVGKALRAAATIRRLTGAKNIAPQNSTPQTAEDPAVKTRRELLDRLRYGGRHADEAYSKLYPLGLIIINHARLSQYNIREGDALRFTLDGDAEHGELALVTHYSETGERYCYAAFLCVEGGHFCLRRDSPLECERDHRAPELLTVIGRVVRVERGGLPVRLKGLELRGLPFADDAGEATEAGGKAA